MSRSRSSAILERAAEDERITAGFDAVEVGELAKVAADLGCQVGLDVFRASLLDQRIGDCFRRAR